jgi:hypothetical protein
VYVDILHNANVKAAYLVLDDEKCGTKNQNWLPLENLDLHSTRLSSVCDNELDVGQAASHEI